MRSQSRWVVTLALLAVCTGSCSEPEVAPTAEPGDYRRILVLGPSTTANIWAAGLGDRVAAVSDYCTVPGAAGRPRVGGQLDPSLERITELQPDLVLVQGEVPLLERWCVRTQTPFRSFRTDSLAGWFAELSALGELLEDPAAFATVAEDAQRKLDALRNSAAYARPRTLLVASRRPGEIGGLLVAGPSSFLSELLVVAGGSNVLPESTRDYIDLNEEQLLKLQPEYIVEFHPGGLAEGDDPLATWRSVFPRLPAVAAGRVLVITGSDALMPGPSMPDTAAGIAAALASFGTPAAATGGPDD